MLSISILYLNQYCIPVNGNWNTKSWMRSGTSFVGGAIKVSKALLLHFYWQCLKVIKKSWCIWYKQIREKLMKTKFHLRDGKLEKWSSAIRHLMNLNQSEFDSKFHKVTTLKGKYIKFKVKNKFWIHNCDSCLYQIHHQIWEGP